jgi:hypothetical protein
MPDDGLGSERSIMGRMVRGGAWGLGFGLGAALCGSAEAAVWFVVGERQVQRNDSFLLPLDDADDIAAARQLIAQGPGGGVGSIVVARIGAGSDGLNRDVRAAGQPLWSWHVSEFVAFADAAIELCDGWPGYIQQDVDAFIANTNGQICFWSYTVVAELAAPPPFAINEALDGAWFNPATPGQGYFIDVLSAQGQLFLGWFTFVEAGAMTIGSSDQRWLTAQGPYAGARASLRATNTSGGAFNDPRPVQNTDVGSVELEFSDCNHALARYALAGNLNGEIPLRRLVPIESCGR